MRYLKSEQILFIHSAAVSKTGGSQGVRDWEALRSIENLPQQEFGETSLYQGVFTKAAVYARSIIMNHPFIDGNKRTGMASAATFLELNGYELIVKEGEIEDFAPMVVEDKLDIQEIAKWLEKHTKKL
ncbi:MAG: type II toxin-antitoxin system death-on-curing family toxin [Candidatus Colwellbacteria bacterium]